MIRIAFPVRGNAQAELKITDKFSSIVEGKLAVHVEKILNWEDTQRLRLLIEDAKRHDESIGSGSQVFEYLDASWISLELAWEGAVETFIMREREMHDEHKQLFASIVAVSGYNELDLSKELEHYIPIDDC